MSIRETNRAILWIEIYPVDSAIQSLNNRGQDYKPCAWCSRLNYDHQFINNQILALKKAVWGDEDIQYWLVQKFGLWCLYRFDTIQVKPSFLFLNPEEDKRAGIHSTKVFQELWYKTVWNDPAQLEKSFKLDHFKVTLHERIRNDDS